MEKSKQEKELGGEKNNTYLVSNMRWERMICK
jgi:hypothetical protein